MSRDVTGAADIPTPPQHQMLISSVSTHRVEVFHLPPLSKHQNADNLSIIQIPHTQYTYVGRTADWIDRVGQLVAWVQPDSIVKLERPEFKDIPGLREPRIRARRLRDVVSYGLLVPLPADTPLKPGDDAAAFLEVEHYDPEDRLSTTTGNKALKRANFAPAPPGYYPKYAVDAFLKYYKVFVPGELVYIFEKLHGCNARYVKIQDVQYCGSRQGWKQPFSSPPRVTLEELVVKTGSEERAQEILNKIQTSFKPHRDEWWAVFDAVPGLKRFCEERPGWCAYGELYGQVPGFPYDCAPGEPRLRLFDVLTPNQKWLNPADLIALGQEYQIPLAPLVAAEPFELERVIHHATGNSLLGDKPHIREGVVIKPAVDRWDPHLGRVSLKVINPAYLEKN